MSTHLQELRECPTRVDHRPVLVAHQVTLPMCQKRQRGHYHKCSTCVFQNAAERPPVPSPARRLPAGPPPLPQLVAS